MIQLSKRLQAVAEMVSEKTFLCDVGTDHAYIPIYLVEHKTCPSAIAMDINEGPLERAKENIDDHMLLGSIQLKLSDGLRSYQIPEAVAHGKEAASLVIAGMGGGLMVRILSEDRDKTDSFYELILEPQSEVQKVRYFLRTSGWQIVDENFLEEDGKFYPVIHAKKNPSFSSGIIVNEDVYTLEDYYGPVLLQKGPSDFVKFLAREKNQYVEILKKLDHTNETRKKEIEQLLQRNAKAMDCCRSFGLGLF